MRNNETSLKFNISQIIGKINKLPMKPNGVVLKLPFANVTLELNDVERKAAREIVIRLKDRRVLNAFECCDHCIDEALKSLQEIRGLLVDKEVELSDYSMEPLYFLMELMLEPIRQFLTFEQRLGRLPHNKPIYFSSLEMLRAHLTRCLIQIIKIAQMDVEKVFNSRFKYDETWEIEAYEKM